MEVKLIEFAHKVRSGDVRFSSHSEVVHPGLTIETAQQVKRSLLTSSGFLTSM